MSSSSLLSSKVLPTFQPNTASPSIVILNSPEKNMSSAIALVHMNTHVDLYKDSSLSESLQEFPNHMHYDFLRPSQDPEGPTASIPSNTINSVSPCMQTPPTMIMDQQMDQRNPTTRALNVITMTEEETIRSGSSNNASSLLKRTKKRNASSSTSSSSTRQKRNKCPENSSSSATTTTSSSTTTTTDSGRDTSDYGQSSNSSSSSTSISHHHITASSRMKCSDVKNTFTTSYHTQVIRCNRTSNNQNSYIRYDDIKPYFYFPESEAAKRLGCSKSKLKRIKTRLNIERWPYRRIQSLLNQKSSNKKENLSHQSKAKHDHSTTTDNTRNVLNHSSSNAIDLAVQFVLDYPNLITKYTNEDITLIATRMDRIKISNLLL
ncbi:hypothetical protein C9374_007263 [Naegleria lovaniensis]|uniref:RWP-RK domain-containing protein n=1 Tax=Naegleria lovaniensis TaxID=51637 RepID=A0AA88H7F9_NAELO|nr:uncharacterized protein C9374_007263 [Naegleria lovaniensis]KAG2393732.1 hypothetical protein C9374_007263 [Naegleria lovaniensis]